MSAALTVAYLVEMKAASWVDLTVESRDMPMAETTAGWLVHLSWDSTWAEPMGVVTAVWKVVAMAGLKVVMWGVRKGNWMVVQ